MAKRSTYKCFGCSDIFNVADIIEYEGHRFCKACYTNKLEREKFSKFVCELFNAKSPGPMVWSQRKNIQAKYGYTDDTIIKCLDYVYNVLHFEKEKPTLGLVTPMNIEKMLQYRKKQEYEDTKLIQAFIQGVEQRNTTFHVKVRENKDTEEEWNLDDCLKE